MAYHSDTVYRNNIVKVGDELGSGSRTIWSHFEHIECHFGSTRYGRGFWC